MKKHKEKLLALGIGIAIVIIVLAGIAVVFMQSANAQSSDKILSAQVYVQYKDGTRQRIYPQSGFQFLKQSILYNGKEISAIYVYPILTLEWVGSLNKISTQTNLVIKVPPTPGSQAPYDSWIAISSIKHQGSYAASEMTITKVKEGILKGKIQLKPFEITEQQIEGWIKQEYGSNYVGSFSLGFSIDVSVQGTFASGQTDKVAAEGYGVLSLTRKDPGKFVNAAVQVGFNVDKVSGSGGGSGGSWHGPKITGYFIVKTHYRGRGRHGPTVSS